MHTAYPVENGRFSNHFSRASHFNIVDTDGVIVDSVELPNTTNACRSKHLWQELLKQVQVDHIVVRFIGERMLSRYLDAGFTVDQAPQKVVDVDARLLTTLTPLTYGDGRPSPKYNKKEKTVGCKGHESCNQSGEDHSTTKRTCNH